MLSIFHSYYSALYTLLHAETHWTVLFPREDYFHEDIDPSVIWSDLKSFWIENRKETRLPDDAVSIHYEKPT